MSWETFFQATSLIALIAWAVLIAAPRGALAGAAVMYAGVGLLCLAYTAGLVAIIASAPGQAAQGFAGFGSIDGVRAIFASDAGVAIGWTHYLALDLFAGLWIAKDADAKGFGRLAQAPVLLLTLMAGPAGLLVWLAVRERAARRAARAAGNRRGG